MSYWPFLSDPGPIIVRPCQPLTDDLVEIKLKFGLPHYLDATWGQNGVHCHYGRMMNNSDCLETEIPNNKSRSKGKHLRGQVVCGEDQQ